LPFRSIAIGQSKESNMHHHESNTKIEATAAAVSEWQMKVRTINEKIATAEAAFAASEARRREHALAASLGDDAAQKNLDQVLQDDIRTQRDLDNLKLSLPLAEAKLREAENAHRAVIAEVRKAEVAKLVLERIDVAREYDRAAAESAAWLQRYHAIGNELHAILADPMNMSLNEGVEGWHRVAKSLPAPFATLQKRLPGVFFGGGGSLAQAEASYWGVTDFKKDAA
jgi:hypothetical protein